MLLNRTLHRFGRALHVLGRIVLGLVLLALIGAGALAWRLSQGPIAMPWLAQRLEQTANGPREPGGRPTRLVIGTAALAWQGFRLGVDHPLDIRLDNIAVIDADKTVLDRIDRLDMSVSLPALLIGHVTPRTVAAEGVRLRVLRGEDGSVALDIGSLAETLDSRAPAPAAPGSPPAASPATPASPAAPASSGPPASSAPANFTAELASPLQSDLSARERGHGALRLNQLRQVTVHDVAIAVVDHRLGADWRIAPATIDLTRQASGGVTGSAAADIALGGGPALHATADFRLQSGGTATEITAHVSPFAPATLTQGALTRAAPTKTTLTQAPPTQAPPTQTPPTLAPQTLAPQTPTEATQAAPALQQAAGFAVPVEASLRLELGPDLAPRHFDLHAQAGAGTVQFEGAATGLASASLDATGGPNSITLRKFALALTEPDGSPGMTLGLHGDAARADGHVTAHLGIDLDGVSFADLPRLWPKTIGRGARPWLTQNIVAGTAHDGHFALTIEAPADLSGARVTAASGSMTGSDLAVYWLRPLPPVQHATATITLTGPDTLQIAAQGGRVAVGKGWLSLHDGLMKIWGLQVKDQYSDITLNGSGELADVVALLSEKRLNLLSAHPLPLKDPSGKFTADLHVQLELDNRVTIDQITIGAHAKLTEVHLGSVAMGRDLDAGAFDLTADNDGLKATGTGQFAHIPTNLAIGLDFRPGPPTGIATRLDATATATAAQLAALGFDTGGAMTGQAVLHAVYGETRAGPATLTLDANLAGASLDSGQLGWRKPPGQAATAHAVLHLDHDRLIGIDDLLATAPDLSIRGSADMADGAPQTLLLQRAVVGRTDLHGTIRFPRRTGEPIVIDLAGPQIDLAGQFDQAGGHKGKAKQRPAHPVEHAGPPWRLQARFDKVVLAANHVVGPLSATAASNGRVISSARVQVTGGVSMLGTIGATRDGRALSITADDAGALLQALDIVDTIRGGRLVLNGIFDDRSIDHPLTGSADITDFRLSGAPAAARVLEAMTLYGMVSVLRGPGIEIDRLIAPFRFDQQRLTLDDARAYNSALGVTAKGTLDLDADTADITGTIVPAYLFNSFLGKIPLIGRLFSPEQGGGVFSATYSVRGSLDDPAVKVNPLAAVAPGFLRGVFGIFGKL